jgi:hypothetical protein
MQSDGLWSLPQLPNPPLMDGPTRRMDRHSFSRRVSSNLITIASAEKDLLALDAGLDHLDDIKGRLVARRKLLLHYRAANLSLIAPIRRLPAEILSQVFLQCIPEESIFLAKTAPLVLSQVCRQWREVALSNQLLWNTLTLDPNHSGNPQFAKALVDIWLSMGNH